MAEPHTHSYYAATVNAETDYPQLMESLSCDVAIIGGGFSGVRAAFIFFDDGSDIPEKIYYGSHEQPANSVISQLYDEKIYYGYNHTKTRGTRRTETMEKPVQRRLARPRI